MYLVVVGAELLIGSNWECFRRPHRVPVEPGGMQAMVYTATSPCCCKGGGSKQQTGLQFLSLPQGIDKVLISMGPLSLPCGRDKNWNPVCCFDPPFYNNRPHYTTFPHRYGNLQNPEGVLMGFETGILKSLHQTPNRSKRI